MPDYRVFIRGKQTVAVDRRNRHRAAELAAQGFVKQSEEVYAASEDLALARFADLRRTHRRDQQHFLSGAGAMPLIGLLTAIAALLFRRKKGATS